MAHVHVNCIELVAVRLHNNMLRIGNIRIPLRRLLFRRVFGQKSHHKAHQVGDLFKQTIAPLIASNNHFLPQHRLPPPLCIPATANRFGWTGWHTHARTLDHHDISCGYYMLHSSCIIRFECRPATTTHERRARGYSENDDIDKLVVLDLYVCLTNTHTVQNESR